MDVFNKLLTNIGALTIQENKGYEYSFTMTHMGLGDELREISGEIRIQYGQFNVYTNLNGLFLDLHVLPETYKVARIQGMMIHTWKTNYIVDGDTRTYGVGGELYLNVRDKGFVWSCIQNGQDMPTYFVTKKRRHKR